MMAKGAIMQVSSVTVTKADDDVLREVQALSQEMAQATEKWSKATLALIHGPQDIVSFIKAAPKKAEKIALILTKMTPDVLVSQVSKSGVGVVLQAFEKSLEKLLPLLDKVKAKQAKDVRDALIWLDEFKELLGSLDEGLAETGLLTKELPGGGIHGHSLKASKSDGGHVHVLQLSDGTNVLTGRDGIHSHSKEDLKEKVQSGRHSHSFELPDGTTLKVTDSGEHIHEIDGERTSYGGVHQHEVTIGGKVHTTLLPETINKTEKLAVADISPEKLSQVNAQELLNMNRRVHQLYAGNFEGNKKRTVGGLSREDLINAASFVFDEMKERNFKIDTSSKLYAEVRELQKSETAPVNPSGEGNQDPISFEDVTKDIKPIILRKPCVSLVGSIASRGSSRNDIDVLIHGPLDEATRKVIEFRIGRMFEPEISQRLQFHDEKMGGPFTSHSHLYDLVLIPRDDLKQIIQMSEMKKQDDPLMVWPVKKKTPGVIQLHAIGKAAHLDFRFKVDGYLIGWTVPAQKPGKVSNINTVGDARKISQGYSLADGNEYLKPVLAPSGLLAVPKARQPLVWLGIDNRVFSEGEIGASTNEAGVMIAVAKPTIEWGMQQPFFHEYFLTGDKTWNGIFYVRQLLGDGRDPEEQEAGRETPEGELFWKASIAKSALPSVLKKRAVDMGRMPPVGESALPKSLEEITPAEFRFWNAKSLAEAKKLRAELANSKFFTEQNVKIVDGEFRRIVQKSFIFLPNELSKEEQEQKAEREGRFTLSWLYFRGPMVVRVGPSRQSWLLMLENKDGAGLDAFALQSNPLGSVEPITAVMRKLKGTKLLTTDKEIKPGEAIDGTVLNETKETPAFLRIQDKGNIKVIDEEKDYIKVLIDGEKLKGTFTLTREEEGSEIWVFERAKIQKKTGPWAQWGGSGLLAHEIVKKIPDHRVYIEPFMGAASVLFTKERSEVEVLSDLDPESIFAMRFVQSITEKKIEQLQKMNWKADKMLFQRAISMTPRTPLERFWKFFYVRRHGFSGKPSYVGREATPNLKRLLKFRDRLKGVKILKQDYRETLKQYDSIDSFSYIDPPYPGEWQDSAGSVKGSDFDLAAFTNAVSKLKGSYLVALGDQKDHIKALDRLTGKRFSIETRESSSQSPTNQKKANRHFVIRERTRKADGDRKDQPGRVDLKPGQKFRPMKPRTADSKDVDVLLKDFATPAALKAGIWVEPKWNGMRAVASKDADGKVSLWFEDSKDERVEIIPSIKRALERIKGSFIIDCELLDFDAQGNVRPRATLSRFTGPVDPVPDAKPTLFCFRVLYWSELGGNLTADDEDVQGQRVWKFVEDADTPRVANTPRRNAKNKEGLEAAIKWASKMPGSEGAMLKRSDATYSLGGNTSSWAKLKTVRTITAMVVNKDPVKGSSSVWNYECVIGPILEHLDQWLEDDVVKYKGKYWAKIGVTGNTNIEMDVGDILQASVFELFVNKKPDKRSVHWFGPATVDTKRDELKKPMAIPEVVSMATSQEIKKLMDRAVEMTMPILKTKEEQFVLGVVLEPNDGEDKEAPLDPDTQGDIYSKEEIRQAAHLFMEYHRNLGLQHKKILDRDSVRILESYISPVSFAIAVDGETTTIEEAKKGKKEFQIVRKGTWLLAMRIVSKKMWSDVKAGKLTGLSIGGSARRVAERKILSTMTKDS